MPKPTAKKKAKKNPTDVNLLARSVVEAAIGEPLNTTEEKPSRSNKLAPSPISQYLAKIGREGGLKGGKARAERLTKEERRSIALNAAKARWKHKI